MLPCPKPRSPRVALIQLNVPDEAHPSTQSQRAAAFIRQAVKEKADLVVHPEMALGCCNEKEKLRHFSQQCAVELVNFQNLAKELSVNIIPGSMHEVVLDIEGNVLHYCNTSYYIDRHGTILLHYRKVNLWGSERNNFRPGTVHRVLQTEEFGPLGILICWDLAFPEAFRMLLKQDARMIVIPILWKTTDCGPKGLAYSKDSERKFVDSVVCARAFEQNMGGSQIAVPFKGPVVKAGCGEQVVVHEIEFGDILEDAEQLWNIRADVNSEGWYSARCVGEE